MNTDKRRILFVSFLAFFALIVTCTQFFHQEKTIQPLDECPICIWQMNAVALATLYFLVLIPIFIVIRYLITNNSKIQFCSDFHCFNHRAPPWNQ
jgi:hypothetical protein